MGAELLREAAAVMRERAEAATPGPWEVFEVPTAIGVTAKWTRILDTSRKRQHRPDAAHIASWHPAVALAVADLLDAQVDAGECPADPDWQAALTVARAYLGVRRMVQGGHTPTPAETQGTVPTHPQRASTGYRVGRHYGIHVYQGDRPVATFLRADEAAAFVAARNGTP